MHDIWFTSDTHFGHKNIIEFEHNARPFATIQEMHEAMIERWNNVVKPKDLVYHLGDVVFGKGYLPIMDRLNGRKRLVMGNHDQYESKVYLQYFEKLYGCKFWERCVLTHMPVHPNGLGARWLLNVHGHLHSRNVTKEFRKESFEGFSAEGWLPDPNYFNVSVEQNNLTPIHADIIRDRVKAIDQ